MTMIIINNLSFKTKTFHHSAQYYYTHYLRDYTTIIIFNSRIRHHDGENPSSVIYYIQYVNTMIAGSVCQKCSIICSV